MKKEAPTGCGKMNLKLPEGASLQVVGDEQNCCPNPGGQHQSIALQPLIPTAKLFLYEAGVE